MSRLAKALLCFAPLGSMLVAQTQPTVPNNNTSTSDAPDARAGAYYNFAMGRLYAELAAAEGNKNDYVSRAIQHYREALKLAPSEGIIIEELTDLYIQTNHLRDAVAQAEDMLKQNPNNLEARRMLGRIYVRMLGNNQSGRIPEDYLRQAIEQYQKITEKDPKDTESWVVLGRLYRFSNKNAEAEKAFNTAAAVEPDNEDALTSLAMMYAEQGDSKRAIEKLKTVADKSPSERLLLTLADQYEQIHDYKSAAEVLRKAAELAPENGQITAGLAKDLLYSDQVDEALKLYQQLAADEPRVVQYPLSIAEIYRVKRDVVKAREALGRAKQIDPQNLQVRYEEVKLLEVEGKNDQALTALKGMLDETSRRTYTPDDARARSTLLEEYGILSRNQEKYQQAVDAFRQLAALGSDFTQRGTLQVIDTYRQSKDYTAALKEADAALQKYPEERMFRMEHATVLSDQGKIDAAAAELRSLLNKGKEDRETLLSIAQVYQTGKRYSEMSTALNDAEKLSTTNQDKEAIYFMRGAMYERMKKFDAAEAEFRKVLELNPENAGALNYLGYMFADRSVRLDEAYQLIKKALDTDPENGAYLDSLGWVYFRQGKLDEAESTLVRALDRIGQDPTVHDHLGDVYSRLGKIKEAITQWQASLKAFQNASAGDQDPDEVAKVSKKLDDARVRLAQEMKQKK